jgi:outer membrane protein assembly factor BamB
MRVATVVTILTVVTVASTSIAPRATAAHAPSEPSRLLVALDEGDGSVLWRAAPHGDTGGHLDAKFVTHSLVIAEEFVCHSGERRYEPGDVSVVAFDARTGHERWRVPDVELSAAAFGRIAPPAPDVLTIPVTSTVTGTPRLVDLDRGTDAGPISGQPVAGSPDLLLVTALDAFSAAASTRGIVTAIDRRTGAARWTRNLGANLFSIDANASAVAVAAGPIPDPGTDLGQVGGVEVLDPATGTRRWAAALMPAYGVDLATGHVVFQNLDRLRAVDVSTGQPAWDIAVRGLLDKAPSSRDTLLALQGADAPNAGVIVSAFDARSGAARWSHTASAELLNPGLANDRVVTVGTRSHIVAYDTVHGRRRWARPTPARSEGVVAAANRVYISGGCTVSND